MSISDKLASLFNLTSEAIAETAAADAAAQPDDHAAAGKFLNDCKSVVLPALRAEKARAIRLKEAGFRVVLPMSAYDDSPTPPAPYVPADAMLDVAIFHLENKPITYAGFLLASYTLKLAGAALDVFNTDSDAARATLEDVRDAGLQGAAIKVEVFSKYRAFATRSLLTCGNTPAVAAAIVYYPEKVPAEIKATADSLLADAIRVAGAATIH